MQATFKSFGQKTWSINDMELTNGTKVYNINEIENVQLFAKPTVITNGVLQFDYHGKNIALAFSNKVKEEGLAAFEYLKTHGVVGVENETVSNIQEMLREAGVTDTFGTKKELAELPNIIRPGEKIIYATSGLLSPAGVLDMFGVTDANGATVLVVLTDERVVFVDKGMLWGLKVAEIPLDVINSVTSVRGAILDTLTIMHNSRSFSISHISKGNALIFADRARDLKSIVKKDITQSINQIITKSPMEQVKELKELLDLDIITKDEFDKKKKELLGL